MKSSTLSVFMHPRTFWFSKFSGVSRYVCELSEELFKRGIQVHIPITNTPNEYLKQSSFFRETSAETCPAPLYVRALNNVLKSTPLREKARRHVLRHEALKALRNGVYDVIHPTHNNATEILPLIGNTPLVITIHDMTQELFPGSFAKHDPSRFRKQRFASRADRIIAISECTKNDIVRLLNISPDKIDVVHHGNSLVLPANIEAMDISLPSRYVLFVGGRNGYKNFSRFAEAFSKVAANDNTLRLICAGGGAFTSNEMKLLNQLQIAERCEQRWVTDEELAILYNRSLCFVYPSEYEGFGLPILEAFSCGAPVLCSHASCFPEIAAKGAEYFSPCDIQEMAACMNLAIESADMRQRLRDAGKLRLADFSWHKTAEKTIESYLKAIDSKKKEARKR